LTHEACTDWLATEVLPGNSDMIRWVTLYRELLKDRFQLSRNPQFSDEMTNAQMDQINIEITGYHETAG